MPTVANDAQLRAILGRPFAEQVAFFRGKLGNLVPTQVWTDMLGAAHDTGFMVAGAQTADLLQGLATAMEKGISQGTGIAAFRKDFQAIVKASGWAYNGDFNWRTRVIYQTNMATSYAAGRLAQLRAGGFPIWIYKHADGVIHPRPLHVAWNGMALAADDPWWPIHYPPCDWGCHCRVIGARSPASAARLGGTLREAPDDGVDPKTGMPAGVGKGWGYMPGDTVSDVVTQMAAKTQQWDYTLAKAYMQNVPEAARDALATAYRKLPSVADDARRYAAAVKAQSPSVAPYKTLGLITSAQDAQIELAIHRSVKGFDYALEKDAVRHVFGEHGEGAETRSGQRPVSAADFALIPEILNHPDIIEDGGKSWTTGQPLVRMLKQIGNATYRIELEVRAGRKSLVVLSMLIWGHAP